MSLNEVMETVIILRQKNEDVFMWPGPMMSAHYVHEEVCELVRYIQRLEKPKHLRADKKPFSREGMMMEYGDALFMLLTLGIELQLDPDKCLAMSMAKIIRRCIEKRGEGSVGTP